MSYKKLGKYIKLIDNRNRDLSDAPLLGVSVQKRFITSVANTIGSDMSKYKLIEKNNFVYIPDTSRRGDKIGIALLKDFDEAMISQAYTSFKIIDENELSPDYLMMWFSRPEFDRYARYHSIGSVREVFDWKDMCEVELPIPSIEEQRQIVAQYQSIANKIRVNEQICVKLEATAQALYKHWFVDFEFPISDTEAPLSDTEALEVSDVASSPSATAGYKSSGGMMVWNEELGKDIPEGWEVDNLGEFVVLSQGIQVDTENQFFEKLGRNRFIRIIDYTDNSTELPRYVDISDDRYYVKVNDVVVIRYGDAGTICRRLEGIIANNLFKVTPISNSFSKNFIYYFLKEPVIQNIIKNSSGSSTMPAISHGDIKHLKISYNFKLSIHQTFDNSVNILETQILDLINENQKLTQLQSLLLSRLATLEG